MSSSKKSRIFLGVFYPDAENYNCQAVLDKLPEVFEEFAYITHDMDVTADGELIKPHIHWVGKRDSPTLISTLSNALEVPEQYIEFARNYKFAMRYLVHADHPDKYQYDYRSVTASFVDFKRYVQDNLNDQSAKRILNFLECNPSISKRALSRWCAENELWAEFRRGFAIWCSILRELNDPYSNDAVKSKGDNHEN